MRDSYESNFDIFVKNIPLLQTQTYYICLQLFMSNLGHVQDRVTADLTSLRKTIRIRICIIFF